MVSGFNHISLKSDDFVSTPSSDYVITEEKSRILDEIVKNSKPLYCELSINNLFSETDIALSFIANKLLLDGVVVYYSVISILSIAITLENGKWVLSITSNA